MGADRFNQQENAVKISLSGISEINYSEANTSEQEFYIIDKRSINNIILNCDQSTS